MPVPHEERALTPLQRQLAESSGARPGALDAFKMARRDLLAGARLDMRALAGQLGVNRVTLYRWVGSREQLLVEILWSLTERNITPTWAELETTPGPRVPETLRRFVRDTINAPGVRRFLHGESEVAMRLLTLKSGGFQPRLLGLIWELLATDVKDGRVATPLALDELAYAVLRITESYIYLPVINGEPADPDALARVLRVLVTASEA